MKKRIYKTVLFIELERDYFRIHRQTVECAQRLRFGRQESFGFYLDRSCWSPFLKSGVTFANFQIDGKLTDSMETF